MIIGALLQRERKRRNMDNQVHNQIVSFIGGIADDCLRDVYVRGKYRDVICLLYTSPSPRDPKTSRMPSSA